MSLRVMLVTDVYPPQIGGVEQQMQMLSRSLKARGSQVWVCTSWQPGLPEHESEPGVEIYRIKSWSSRVPWFSSDPRRRHHPPFPDPGAVLTLRRLINRFQPQVIHAYGWITYSCAAALVGKDIPLVLSVREYGYTCALRTMMQFGQTPCSGPAPAKCLRCAADFYGPVKGLAAALGVLVGRPLLRWKTRALHSVSAYMRSNIHRDLFKPGRALELDVVIPSFRPDPAPAPEAELAPYLDQLPKEPFILFVGALRRVKGLEPLLEAYACLESPPPLVLIGVAAPDTPRRFPPNVHVLYSFPHAAVMAAWKRALFGVAPSIWPEPFGSVIHEAMSQGCPVIGTTPGGQGEIITAGENGLLVPANDVQALASAMRTLLLDPEYRARLGAAARQRARLFTAGQVVPRFEDLYRRLAHQPERSLCESDPVESDLL
jgi:glycosyltransferase involved in cell wall biosynthesis